MGGVDICGACDCGGMFEMGGKKYIRMDFLSAYGYEKSHAQKPAVSVEELIQTILDTQMKESRRNNDGNSYHPEGYKYSGICSCGSCHRSLLIAQAIAKLYEGR
jgi:hypothetical protein